MAVPKGYAKDVDNRGDVPAGPGDAGYEDRAELRDDAPLNARKGRQATLLFAGLVALGLVVWLILSLAA